jgi:hypothetical protein
MEMERATGRGNSSEGDRRWKMSITELPYTLVQRYCGCRCMKERIGSKDLVKAHRRWTQSSISIMYFRIL